MRWVGPHSLTPRLRSKTGDWSVSRVVPVFVPTHPKGPGEPPRANEPAPVPSLVAGLTEFY